MLKVFYNKVSDLKNIQNRQGGVISSWEEDIYIKVIMIYNLVIFLLAFSQYNKKNQSITIQKEKEDFSLCNTEKFKKNTDSNT